MIHLSAFTPAPKSVLRYEQGRLSASGPDDLATEEPLEIRIGDEPLAVTMRTPGHDEDLAAGFCLTEQIIASADELDHVSPCSEAAFGNVINVSLTHQAMVRRADQIQKSRREMYLSSSCGLCGKQTLDRIRAEVEPLRDSVRVSSAVFLTLVAQLSKAQRTFDRTGGLHAAGLFSLDGRLILAREDVGRHNAVDKVVGALLLGGQWPPAPSILLVSGRLSFEIVQKAAIACIPILAAVSAPSSLAVDLAVEMNITLIGFLREGRMNLYHDSGRINEA